MGGGATVVLLVPDTLTGCPGLAVKYFPVALCGRRDRFAETPVRVFGARADRPRLLLLDLFLPPENFRACLEEELIPEARGERPCRPLLNLFLWPCEPRNRPQEGPARKHNKIKDNNRMAIFLENCISSLRLWSCLFNFIGSRIAKLEVASRCSPRRKVIWTYGSVLAFAPNNSRGGRQRLAQTLSSFQYIP